MASSPLSPNTMGSIMRPAGRSGVVVRCRRSCASGLANVPWREGGSHGLFDLAVRPVFRWLHDSSGHAGLE